MFAAYRKNMDMENKIWACNNRLHHEGFELGSNRILNGNHQEKIKSNGWVANIHEKGSGRHVTKSGTWQKRDVCRSLRHHRNLMTGNSGSRHTFLAIFFHWKRKKQTNSYFTSQQVDIDSKTVECLCYPSGFPNLSVTTENVYHKQNTFISLNKRSLNNFYVIASKCPNL